MRFLLDTGATTMLNLKSFSSGRSQKIQVTSWSGTAATSAREVTLPEFTLGAHRLKDLKLPAIDLSPIGKACGGQIDGILGVDLLDKMGVTIDLKRQVASAGAQTPDAKTLYDQMELGMHHCMTAFEAGKVAELQDCFDPEIVFYTPQGVIVGVPESVGHTRRSCNRGISASALAGDSMTCLRPHAEFSLRRVRNDFPDQNNPAVRQPCPPQTPSCNGACPIPSDRREFWHPGVCAPADANLALEVDGYAHFVEQVHAKNPVNLAAARLADGTEIDGRQFQIFER